MRAAVAPEVTTTVGEVAIADREISLVRNGRFVTSRRFEEDLGGSRTGDADRTRKVPIATT